MRTLQYKHIALCQLLELSELAQNNEETLRRDLVRVITSLWQKEDSRLQKPNPGLNIVEQTLWETVPDYIRCVSDELRKHTGRQLPLTSTPITFRSLLGCDGDGILDVTPSDIRHISLLYRQMTIDLYIREVGIIETELNGTSCSMELSEPSFDHRPVVSYFRVALQEVENKLNNMRRLIKADLSFEQDCKNDYGTANQLLQPLLSCYQYLQSCGFGTHADKLLANLIRRLVTFEMVLVKFDLRQDPARHANTLVAIMANMKEGVYTSWDEERKIKFLTGQLTGRMTLLRPDIVGPSDVEEVISTFRIGTVLRSESLGSYVICMVSSACDVLAAMLLQMFVSVKEGRHPIELLKVVLSFETVKDLRAAGSLIRRLLSINWYREHIMYNQNAQLEIILGPSDSKKDEPFTECLAIHRAKVDIVAVCKEYNINAIVYHKRGVRKSTVGLSYLGIRTQPPTSVVDTVFEIGENAAGSKILHSGRVHKLRKTNVLFVERVKDKEKLCKMIIELENKIKLKTAENGALVEIKHLEDKITDFKKCGFLFQLAEKFTEEIILKQKAIGCQFIHLPHNFKVCPGCGYPLFHIKDFADEATRSMKEMKM